MTNEERNRRIDELAYSIKHEKLSEGQQLYKTDLLFSLLLEYKEIKIGNFFDVTKAKSTDVKSSGEGSELKQFVAYDFYEEDILTEHIEEAYFAAWRDYLDENTTFVNVKGSFVHMFNIYLKMNMKSFYHDISKVKLGDASYGAKESMVKYIIKNIIQDLGIKDFIMPRNVMNYDVVESILKKHGVPDSSIEQVKAVFEDYNTKVMETGSMDDSADDSDRSVFDLPGNREYENESISKNIVNIMTSKVQKVIAKYNFTETKRKYVVCYISLNIAKNSDWIRGEDLDSLNDYIDWDFVDKYRETKEVNDIQFVADYLGIANGTAQKGLKNIADMFVSDD